MKVLLAVDGSVYTRRMVDYVCQHPQLLGETCSMTILTVLAETPVRVRAALGHEEVEANYREDARRILEPVARAMEGHYPNVQSQWKVGPIARTIAETVTDDGHDLIVMGSHGLNALAGLVLGSVTSRVLARCTIPVLIVR